MRLKKHQILVLGALALAALIAAAVYLWRPTMLAVAVGPRDAPEVKLVEAYGEALASQRKDLRLKVQLRDDVRESTVALQRGEVDLAVVRPDVLLPANGLTVAILREEAVIIVAPTAAKIADVADLARKRLGIVARHGADPQLFSTLLGFYDLDPPAVTLTPLALEEVEAAFRERRIDAVGMVAAPTSAAATTLIRAVERVAAERKITFVPVAEADAIAERFPALTPVTVPAGALGGRPRQPEEEAKTIGVSYRLMARSDLDRNTVAGVAQNLFQMRSRIAQAAPAVNQMKAPDTDTSTSATLPNHPGAVDYFNREQLTFMERYGDWIWLAVFSMGGISSGLAWLGQRLARKRRELVDEVLDRLTCLLTEARAATSVVELDALALEIDGLVTHAIRYARHRTTGTRTMGALMLAIDSARAAVADRRRDLVEHRTVPRAASRG